MPIKEFECQACSNRFEELLMLNEPNPTKCPKCGSGELKQLLGTFRISGLGKKSDRNRDDAAAAGGMSPEFDDAGLDTGMEDYGGYGGEDEFDGGMDAPGPGLDDTSGPQGGSDDIGAPPVAGEEE